MADLHDTPEFEEFLHREFPDAASEFPHGVSRRRWLSLMGASFALAGVASTGCRWEKETLLPEAARPMHRIPGVPIKFATASELGGVGQSLLVISFDGRPIKVDGNPDNPQTKGASDVYTQASILQMYDPDRSQAPVQRVDGKPATKTWADADAALATIATAQKAAGGAGLRVLAEASSSPTLAEMRRRLVDAFPQAEWVEYEPLANRNGLAGSMMAFGAPHRTHLNLDQADVIVSLDADFLQDDPSSVKYSRQFGAGRVPTAEGKMNRLYVADSRHSLTGAMADHRVAVRSEQIVPLALALEAAIFAGLDAAEVEKFGARNTVPQAEFLADEHTAAVVKAMAGDLLASRGRSVVMAGPRQPAALHALVHRLNAALGNVGTTVVYTAEPAEAAADPLAGLRKLVDQMKAGAVDTLLILGGNPVYDAPSDLGFKEALDGVKNSIHLSLYQDETSGVCGWHLPRAHALEAWSDVRAYDGLYSIAQPLIEPLYAGRTSAELLAALLGGDEPRTGQELVRRTFNELAGGGSDEAWRLAVHDGFWAGSTWPTASPTLAALEPLTVPEQALATDVPNDDLEIVFVPSPALYDGRFANLAWLQELPDFMTKVTWDNVVLMSAATAGRLGVSTAGTESSVVRLKFRDKESLELPVYVMPGHADGSITVTLGYGRTAAGQVGGSAADGVESVGVDFYKFRETGAMDFARGLTVEPTSKKYHLATTQDHHAIDRIGEEGRDERMGELIREADLVEFQANPRFAQHMIHMPAPFSPGSRAAADTPGGQEAGHGEAGHGHDEHAPTGLARRFDLWNPPDVAVDHKWGMAIDLSKCTGCNACVIACQAENNIAVVGREQVRKGREMQWLRIDRYFSGDTVRPKVVHQPVPCMQCENAPCEQVCPVAATVHSDEGLNDMVYNRCVGTRYCSNNCPYKVRRFNYFNFQKRTPQPLHEPKNLVLKMLFNPEVTVRSRGVMEKCTYCVQRIQNVKIVADNERRPIADGEIQTACQVACSSGAITFGDLLDEQSAVKAEHDSPRAYSLLEELYSRPRTKYLARVRNPNPTLVPADAAHPEHEGHEQQHHA